MESIYIKPDSTIVNLCINGVWYFYDNSIPPLGEGAIGSVYLGFCYEHQGRVAIKKVNSSYVNNPIVRDLIRHEALMVFDHPNIVKTLGLCEYSNGLGDMFLIYEYFPGITFKEHIAQLLISSKGSVVKQVLEDIREILLGLEYLHSNGFVHRDLKPSNMMINDSSIVKLMDLGTVISMAQLQKHPQVEFIGTPSYASPEQVECRFCDARSDIYSIGVVLYELLTGENPFDSSSREEIFHNQLYMPLPPNRNIPPKLFSIIRKATSKKIEGRYASVIELNSALGSYLESEYNKSSHGKILLVTLIVIVGIIILLCFYFLQ